MDPAGQRTHRVEEVFPPDQAHEAPRPELDDEAQGSLQGPLEACAVTSPADQHLAYDRSRQATDVGGTERSEGMERRPGVATLGAHDLPLDGHRMPFRRRGRQPSIPICYGSSDT